MAERIRLDSEDEGSLSVTLGAQRPQRPNRRGSITRPTESQKVVFPEEGGPGLVHASLVEGIFDPQAVPAPDGLGTIGHPVGVGAPHGGKARVEAGVDDGGRVDAHVARAARSRQVAAASALAVASGENLVESADNRGGHGLVVGIPSPGRQSRPGALGNVRMTHLVTRMNPRVGTTGDRRHDLFARGHGEGRFKLALDGAQAGLGGPASKIGAVVAQVEAQAPRAHSSHARTPPIMPASLGTTITSSPMRRRFEAVMRLELPPPR